MDGLRSMWTTTRSRSFRKGCAVSCACRPARHMRLTRSGFPIAVMGKTGTTNDFRDALFVGSTYGPEGITVAVRIGFDDNRSLGPKETGGRVALPVFKEIMLRVYREKLVGPVPEFPPEMEQSISTYLNSGPVETAAAGNRGLEKVWSPSRKSETSKTILALGEKTHGTRPWQ